MKRILVATFAILALVISAQAFTIGGLKFNTPSKDNEEVCKSFANRYEPFDYFLLSIQWPGTACVGKKQGECTVPDFVNDFTLHGLWPQYNNPSTYPECCWNIAFDANAIAPIRDQMDKFWPSYYHSNEHFWTHEFVKHGTCSNSTMDNLEYIYFSNTLKIFSKMHLLDALKGANIIPSHGSYQRERMESALAAAGYPGVVACLRDHVNIGEIRFCVDKNTLQLKKCDQALIDNIHQHNGCKNTINFPPIH